MCQDLNLVTVLLQNQTWADCFFLFCLSGCHFPRTLFFFFFFFLQAEAVVMSEPLTIRGGKKKTKQHKILELETAAASSAVSPCVVHLSRWLYGYVSRFSSDLRIPHLVQCREAFEALQCSPSQRKQNLWTVCWFTHTDSKVKESWLSYSVTLRGLTFRIKYKCLLWWTKASFFSRTFHLFAWVYRCNHYDVKSQAVHQTEICPIIDVYLFELEIFMPTLVFPAEHA